jgi:hypothetical protein
MATMNSRWPGEILENVEDGVEMVDDELGRRQKEGDQEDDKIREDLLYQQPLTPAANRQYVSSIQGCESRRQTFSSISRPGFREI